MGGRRVTTESYMEDVKEIHKGKEYSYKEDWEYTGSRCIIEVHCKDHGWWSTKAYSHRNMKSGCPKCAEEFRDGLCYDAKIGKIARDNNRKYKRHEDRDNDIVKMIFNEFGSSIEILSECVPESCYIYIRCIKHDYKYFRHTSSLWGGRKGCQSCAEEAIKNAVENSRKDQLSVIEKFKSVHGNRYDYSMVNYIDAHTKVKIGCSEHGYFWITPNNHSSIGSGCASCAKSGFDKNKPAILYYLRIPVDGKVYYKVGVTNGKIDKRFYRDRGRYEVVSEWFYEDGQNAYDKEQEILRIHHDQRSPPENFEWYSKGVTEIFNKDVLELDKSM